MSDKNFEDAVAKGTTLFGVEDKVMAHAPQEFDTTKLGEKTEVNLPKSDLTTTVRADGK